MRVVLQFIGLYLGSSHIGAILHFNGLYLGSSQIGVIFRFIFTKNFVWTNMHIKIILLFIVESIYMYKGRQFLTSINVSALNFGFIRETRWG
jgi:hypothetical protein